MHLSLSHAAVSQATLEKVSALLNFEESLKRWAGSSEDVAKELIKKRRSDIFQGCGLFSNRVN